MSMGDEPWRPDDDGAADPDVEWAFFGAHAIEYWVVRDGRLVPAKGSELERIAECERELGAQARLLGWERERRRRGHQPSVIARFVWWCRGLVRSAVPAHLVEPKTTASQGESAPRRQSDVAHRRM